jgi:hypothetical protein
LLAITLVGLAGCASAPESPVTQRAAEQELAETAVLKSVDCLMERGWDVKVSAGGLGVESKIPSGQAEQFDADKKECREKSGINDLNFGPPSDAELEQIYSYELKNAECLRERGVHVPDAPSEQTFKERYTSSDAWFAWRYVGDVPEETYLSLAAACPQYSDSFKK